MLIFFKILIHLTPLFAAESVPSCAISLTDLNAARAVFPRGFNLRIETDERLKSLIREALASRFPELHKKLDDDAGIFPHYVIESVVPFQIDRLRPVGWEVALLEKRRWTHSAFVRHGDVAPRGAEFLEGESPDRPWFALTRLNDGLLQKLRGRWDGPPVFHLRLLDAPVHQLRALWLHGETEDWFIATHGEDVELLGPRQLERWIDALSLSISPPPERAGNLVPEGM